MNGEDSSDDDGDMSESVTVPLRFVERCRIAEAALCDPSTFVTGKGFRRHVDFCKDMTALCKRRERQYPRIRRARGRPSIEMTEAQDVLPNPEPEEKRNIPLKCTRFQCLFCLAEIGLPLEDRHWDFASKDPSSAIPTGATLKDTNWMTKCLAQTILPAIRLF